MEATQIPINRKMDKDVVVYMYNGILLRLKEKEILPFVGEPGKSHGWRSLVGCSPWGQEGLDTNKRLHFHISLSCTGEGHGNPLQCSCLENPTDRGALWATVHGVSKELDTTEATIPY